MDNILEFKSTKSNYYEQNNEKLKEYARHRYHLENGKKKKIIKITKKVYKNKHEIVTEIFQIKRKIKKESTEEIDTN